MCFLNRHIRRQGAICRQTMLFKSFPECLPATHKGDRGFNGGGYFWSGELKSTTYMLNTLEDLGWP